MFVCVSPQTKSATGVLKQPKKTRSDKLASKQRRGAELPGGGSGASVTGGHAPEARLGGGWQHAACVCFLQALWGGETNVVVYPATGVWAGHQWPRAGNLEQQPETDLFTHDPLSSMVV